MDFLVLSWNRSHDYVHQLAQKIDKEGEKFDLIVAIARGGVTVGHMLTDFLKLPMTSFTASSYAEFEQAKTPKISYKIDGKLDEKRILLVDELSDTGATFIHGKEYLQELGAKDIKTAAIFTKPWAQYTPDYFIKTVDAWVIFPWDTRESIEALSTRWVKEGAKKEEIEKRLKELKLPAKYIKKYI